MSTERTRSRAEKARYDQNKLQKKLRRQVGNAIVDYGMIEDGDKVMVCVSGGKDSYTLLDILMNLRLNAPIDFELHAVNLEIDGKPHHDGADYQNGDLNWNQGVVGFHQCGDPAHKPGRYHMDTPQTEQCTEYVADRNRPADEQAEQQGYPVKKL